MPCMSGSSKRKYALLRSASPAISRAAGSSAMGVGLRRRGLATRGEAPAPGGAWVSGIGNPGRRDLGAQREFVILYANQGHRLLRHARILGVGDRAGDAL